MAQSSRNRKRRNNGRPWSKSDLEKLKILYPTTPNVKLGRILGRTCASVVTKAVILGITKEDRYKNRDCGDRWSDEEIRILKEMYYTHTFEEIADVIMRTRDAIATKAVKLKLQKLKIWSKSEDNYIRRYYTSKPPRELAARFGRTSGAVKLRASILGVDRILHCWTPRELELLSKYYPIMHSKELAKLIGRTASNVIAKAELLGIKKEAGSVIANGRRWRKKEVEEVKQIYSTHSIRQTSEILKLPVKSVQLLIRRRCPAKQKRWTEEEKQILRENYDKMTYKELAGKLGRSWQVTEIKIWQLGLYKQKKWKNDEMQILQKEYLKQTPVEQIAKLLGRSKRACEHKITKMKLAVQRNNAKK